ncbi:MAG: hypothetical protein AB1426_08795 [Bacillota bacterium]
MKAKTIVVIALLVFVLGSLAYSFGQLVDNEVKVSGRVPNRKEIEQWLT